jgi:aldehyde dehydrogenase
MRALDSQGAVKIGGSTLDKLTDAVFSKKDGHYALKRDLVGKDPYVLGESAGISVSQSSPMLYAEVDANHPFVIEEQMMPMI